MIISPEITERIKALGLVEQPDGSYAGRFSRRTYQSQAVLLIGSEPSARKREDMLIRLKAIASAQEMAA